MYLFSVSTAFVERFSGLEEDLFLMLFPQQVQIVLYTGSPG